MTERQTSQLIHLLAALLADQTASRPIPNLVFDALLKVLPQVAIETLFVKRVDDKTPTGRLDVLLTQRPEDDPNFPGQWHSPGSFIRRREQLYQVFKRILTRELGGTATILCARPLVPINFFNEPRGHTISWPWIIELEGNPEHGRWFPIDQLPRNLVKTHEQLIPVARQAIQHEPYLRPEQPRRTIADPRRKR